MLNTLTSLTDATPRIGPSSILGEKNAEKTEGGMFALNLSGFISDFLSVYIYQYDPC